MYKKITSQLFPAKLIDITDNAVQTDTLYFIPTTQKINENYRFREFYIYVFCPRLVRKAV